MIRIRKRSSRQRRMLYAVPVLRIPSSSTSPISRGTSGIDSPDHPQTWPTLSRLVSGFIQPSPTQMNISQSISAASCFAAGGVGSS